MASKKIGIIGAGRLGVALAKLFQTAGYEVDIANSGDKITLGLTLRVLLPGVHAKTVDNLVRDNTQIILALPFGQYQQLPGQAFTGKIVIDATNYWEPTEGIIEEFADSGLSSSEFLQRYFLGARVVKTLNHIAYSELWDDSLLTGAIETRAMAVASDDDVARHEVTALVRAIGFEPVDFGALANGVYFQPDTILFNSRLSAVEMNQHKDKVVKS